MIKTTSMGFDVPYLKKELEQIAKKTKVVEITPLSLTASPQQ